MIKIKETIVVEGNYDKAKLSSVFDANIVTTGGFQIYKDKHTLQLLKKLAMQNGVIILTDSDSAGFRIRSYIRSCLQGYPVKNAFIPSVYGKENRKEAVSKEGLLGVEGMEREVLITAFQNAGATFLEEGQPETHKKEPITKQDLYRLGLTGRANSREKREKLLRELQLPARLSSNLMLEVFNIILDKTELQKRMEDRQ